MHAVSAPLCAVLVAVGASASPASRAPSLNAPQWGAVLVAGDHSIDVFDNGVAAIGEQLESRDVAVTVLSAADGSATDERIAASIADLGESGAGGCFAYLTSHGTEDGLLLALESELLSPEALTAMLDEGCGRRPTVVVVSACHSGTFLTEEMTTANRAVYTAARVDRTSFGCSADEEFTFYDGCMLDVLPEAESWEDLNDDVVDCIEEREVAVDVRPSLPQFFVGDSMAGVALPTSILDWLRG